MCSVNFQFPVRGVVLLVAAQFLVSSCSAGSNAPPATTTPTAKHLVLVTIDTLRADRVGAYGNTSVSTPNIDRVAQQGAIALHASAHVPLTRPSHV
jgi:sulfatase-like protein